MNTPTRKDGDARQNSGRTRRQTANTESISRPIADLQQTIGNRSMQSLLGYHASARRGASAGDPARTDSARSHGNCIETTDRSGDSASIDQRIPSGNQSMPRSLHEQFSSRNPRSASRPLSPRFPAQTKSESDDYQSSLSTPNPLDSTTYTQLLDEQPDSGVMTPPITPAQSPGAPMQVSPAPIVGQPTATIATRVRSSTTPAAMTSDRIPPRIDFPVQVTIGNFQIPMLPVQLSVLGSGGNNGTVAVNGGASADMYTSGTVNLKGTAQTTPGNAGNLRLVADWGGQRLATSNSFSVSAIPQDMVLASQTPLTGASRGFSVTQTWSSDSGNLSDLGEAQVSEIVEYVSSTGIFSGLGANNSGYLAASGGSLTDTHSTPTSVLTGTGSRTANQVEIFLDRRTGVTDIPMRNSGFVIQRDVVSQARPTGGTGYRITTSKSGVAVTVTQGTGVNQRSFSVTAGSGNFSLPQWV